MSRVRIPLDPPYYEFQILSSTALQFGRIPANLCPFARRRCLLTGCNHLTCCSLNALGPCSLSCQWVNVVLLQMFLGSEKCFTHLGYQDLVWHSLVDGVSRFHGSLVSHDTFDSIPQAESLCQTRSFFTTYTRLTMRYEAAHIHQKTVEIPC